MKTWVFQSILITVGFVAFHLHAQSIAYDVPGGTVGNQVANEYGVCNDFQVLQPITITQLGAFDSGADGVQGNASISIQLLQINGKKSNLLLETATFDAANPGTLFDGFRFKPLDRPVTLLPGKYTITAQGFNATNLVYNFTLQTGASVSPVILNDGGGLIRFLGCDRFHNGDPSQRSETGEEYWPA